MNYIAKRALFPLLVIIHMVVRFGYADSFNSTQLGSHDMNVYVQDALQESYTGIETESIGADLIAIRD